ncbi:MAG: nucleoside recognition domain-containing protein [Lachnospiraceae bacterium]|nr:nucleoside recognition domain-containing protein [Lachnospiraceae bacterium]
MLNYLWGGMILIAVVYGTITGTVKEVGNAAIDSSKEAVELCITMFGVMALWTGVMQIAQASGLTKKFIRLMRPVLRFLFPELPEDSVANDYIASNMLANILGLGWAATPFGLKAMVELQKINVAQGGKKEEASRAMCTFLILNISSLQLIPVNIIAYRSQYGAVNPADIVGPAIIATSVSTLAAVIFVKVTERKERR